MCDVFHNYDEGTKNLKLLIQDVSSYMLPYAAFGKFGTYYKTQAAQKIYHIADNDEKCHCISHINRLKRYLKDPQHK